MKIAVYCASSSLASEAYKRAAYEVGKEMAQRGIGMVNGAGAMGLMRASADGCLDHGGSVVGIIPTFMIEQGWAHPSLTQTIEIGNMSDRKNMMADMSDGCIVLPGGCGTMDELFELITNKQLGLYLKPIVILNTDGFYDHLIAWLQRSIDDHFMRPIHAQMWCVAQTPAEAVEKAITTPLWDPAIERFSKL